MRMLHVGCRKHKRMLIFSSLWWGGKLKSLKEKEDQGFLLQMLMASRLAHRLKLTWVWPAHGICSASIVTISVPREGIARFHVKVWTPTIQTCLIALPAYKFDPSMRMEVGGVKQMKEER